MHGVGSGLESPVLVGPWIGITMKQLAWGYTQFFSLFVPVLGSEQLAGWFGGDQQCSIAVRKEQENPQPSAALPGQELCPPQRVPTPAGTGRGCSQEPCDTQEAKAVGVRTCLHLGWARVGARGGTRVKPSGAGGIQGLFTSRRVQSPRERRLRALHFTLRGGTMRSVPSPPGEAPGPGPLHPAVWWHWGPRSPSPRCCAGAPLAEQTARSRSCAWGFRRIGGVLGELMGRRSTVPPAVLSRGTRGSSAVAPARPWSWAPQPSARLLLLRVCVNGVNHQTPELPWLRSDPKQPVPRGNLLLVMGLRSGGSAGIPPRLVRVQGSGGVATLAGGKSERDKPQHLSTRI